MQIDLIVLVYNGIKLDNANTKNLKAIIQSKLLKAIELILSSIICSFTKKDSDNVPRFISSVQYLYFDHDISYKTTNEDKYLKYSVSECSIVRVVTVKHVSDCFHLTPSHNKEKLAWKNENGKQILNEEELMTDSNDIVSNNRTHEEDLKKTEETPFYPLPISSNDTPKTTFDTNSKSDQ